LGVGTLGFITAPFLGIVGITLISGVLIFGGSHYLLKKLEIFEKTSNKISEFFKRWDRK